MALFDANAFERSALGQMLKRLAEADAGGAPPSTPRWDTRDAGTLQQLERLGYVRIVRGAGAMSWKIERVELTDEGRIRSSPPASR